MIISLIVAMDENRLIGNAGQLPWHLSADLKNFKQVTMGKPLIMGRKTHESIGKPLPGRTNIVVTRDPDYRADGCVVVNSVDAAISAAEPAEEVMVIGGANLYEQMLPNAERIYLTEIHAAFEGDTWFPEIPEDGWREVSRQEHAPDEDNTVAWSFVVLERS